VIGGADAALGYSAACPENWLHLDVTDAVRKWTTGAWPNHGVAVTASETDSYGWKKFNSNQGLRPPTSRSATPTTDRRTCRPCSPRQTT
jgi:hypothetical protein